MIILALGSNVGDRLGNLSQAVYELSSFISDIKTSSIYETDALLPNNAPEEWDIPFFNMVITGKTEITPQELLKKAKEIEEKIGRNLDSEFWSPRVIDIDIIAYDDLLINHDELTIPHKLTFQRDFVLYPLAEVAPNWQNPVQGENFGNSALELLDDFLYNNISSIRKTNFTLDI